MINRIPYYLDKNKQVTDKIASAQNHLYDKLLHLDIKSLKISEYNKRYLEDKIQNARGTLQLYGRLLYLSLNNNYTSLEDFVLVDYGGGHGLLSFLAKELGVGTVIYNDIYDVSCNDVKVLSNALNLELDHIVCGDVNDLNFYLRENSLSINAITSYDVIEHIYDVEDHFQKLASLNIKFRVVYASGANIYNPRFVHYIKKQQIEAEYKNKEKKWGYKERDSLRAYFDIRRDMIKEYAPHLSSKEIEKLAYLTRGLIQKDIEECTNEYLIRGDIAYRPKHSYNTCDPFTGNWKEHLMEFGWLQQVLGNKGFTVKILAGYYKESGSFLKKKIKLLINSVIWLLGIYAMFIAPYYVVYADFPVDQERSKSLNSK